MAIRVGCERENSGACCRMNGGSGKSTEVEGRNEKRRFRWFLNALDTKIDKSTRGKYKGGRAKEWRYSIDLFVITPGQC